MSYCYADSLARTLRYTFAPFHPFVFLAVLAACPPAYLAWRNLDGGGGDTSAGPRSLSRAGGRAGDRTVRHILATGSAGVAGLPRHMSSLLLGRREGRVVGGGGGGGGERAVSAGSKVKYSVILALQQVSWVGRAVGRPVGWPRDRPTGRHLAELHRGADAEGKRGSGRGGEGGGRGREAGRAYRQSWRRRRRRGRRRRR